MTGHRKALREQRQREGRTAMPKQVQETETIRAKWTMDEAETLAKAAAKLRAFADELDRLHKEGWTLEEPVTDDYGTLIPPK